MKWKQIIHGYSITRSTRKYTKHGTGPERGGILKKLENCRRRGRNFTKNPRPNTFDTTSKNTMATDRNYTNFWNSNQMIEYRCHNEFHTMAMWSIPMTSRDTWPPICHPPLQKETRVFTMVILRQISTTYGAKYNCRHTWKGATINWNAWFNRSNQLC